MYTGKVKWFSAVKGYGFIEIEGRSDLFVHFSGINTDGYRKLTMGQAVTFDIVDGPHGPQAEQVTPLRAEKA